MGDGDYINYSRYHSFIDVGFSREVENGEQEIMPKCESAYYSKQMKPSNRHGERPLFHRIRDSVGQFLLRNVFMRGKIKPVVRNVEPITSPVEVLLPDKSTVQGRFLLWNKDPDNSKHVRLTIQFLNREISASSTTSFHALRNIRRELDCDKILLKCYGASRNVWPSPMGLDVGRAYKLYANKKGDLKDIVSIFDSGPDVEPCTVEEHAKFHKDWLLSIGIDPEMKMIPWKALFVREPIKTTGLFFREKILNRTKSVPKVQNVKQ